ncbi:uncharacterized protein V1518DRAFT_409614 [Limtongia smithiae]|uniref:uncharacterized protein n=1 Tax=Limtongia smithiae TaxID=1125753 RepID=UPI0034CEC41D
MSKYWCKPCKTFVLDSKLGRSQHEVSSRHKSSMDRTLRDLHRQKSQAEHNDRNAQRILQQIERAVSGSGASNGASKPSTSAAGVTTRRSPTAGATALANRAPSGTTATTAPGIKSNPAATTAAATATIAKSKNSTGWTASRVSKPSALSKPSTTSWQVFSKTIQSKRR